MFAVRFKVLSLLAVATMAAGACSSGATASPAATATPPASQSAAASSAAPSASGSESASASASASAAAITVPAAIKSAGKVVFCTDVSYAPEEFFNAQNQPQGSDVDIANDIAKRWNVGIEIHNTGFDVIIGALTAKKCDLVISGMNDTPDRQKQVDFVDYLKVGQGLLVQKGNPKNIHNLDDLSGKTVAVQLGTTNKDALDAENTKLKGEGKPTIDIKTFEKDNDAFAQLKLGRVDCYSTDSPVVAYYNSLPENAGKFEIAGQPIAPAVIGIAMRKGEADMKAGVQQAVDAMYADGTLKQIVAKWGMTDAVVFLK